MLPELYGRVRNVMTEKALANSAASGTCLVKAARAAGTVHMVGYQKRCDPATELARDQIADWRAGGDVGDLRYAGAHDDLDEVAHDDFGL